MNEYNNKSALSRILGNTTFIAIWRVMNALCSLIFVPWTVKSIGLDGFGQLLLITSYLLLISDITHLHSWQPLLHFGNISIREKKYEEFNKILAFCIRADILSGTVGAVSGLAGIELFSHLMRWPDHVKHLAEFCSATILVMNRGWPVGALRLFNRFKIATAVELVGTLTRTVGTFIGYECRFGLTFFVSLWCFTQLVLFVLYNGAALIFVRQTVRSSFVWRDFFISTTNLPGMWKLTIGTSINEILQACYKQISTLLIGAWIGAADAAIFRVSSQITNAMAKPASMLIPTLYPEFIRFRDNNDFKGLKYTISRIYMIISFIGIFIISTSFLIGGNILNYMLHYNYKNGLLFIGFLSISSIIDICVVPINPLLTVFGKYYLIMRYKIFIIIIYIPALFVLVRIFGIWGAVEASLIASATMFVWSAVCAVRVFRQACQESVLSH